MKQYKIFIEEIKDISVGNKQRNLQVFNKKYTLNNEIEEEKLIDKALYDLTSIDECLTVSMHEYDIERNKKDSFDNRASLIITVLLAIILAIYDKIPLKSILLKFNLPLTFIILMQIITTIFIYLSLIIALYYAIRIISVKTTENFDITIINTDFARRAKIYSVTKLLEVYVNLILTHRNKNKIFAKQLSISQISMIISIALIIVNLNLL